MKDFISRQDAINAIVNELDAIDHVPQWVFDRLTKSLEKVPCAKNLPIDDKIGVQVLPNGAIIK